MSRKAMSFFHHDGLVPAFRQAEGWAGYDGRIATLPDIVAALMSTNPTDGEWSSYYTTLSAEYVGLNRDGNRKIVIAHGIGPMADLGGIKKAYSWQYKKKAGPGGRITQEEFWDLLDGKYGKVAVVDFDEYIQFRQYPFIAVELASEAKVNPLLKARLGPQTEDYIEKIAEYARRYYRQKAGLKSNKCYATAHDEPGYMQILRRHFDSDLSEETWCSAESTTRFMKKVRVDGADYCRSWGYLLPREMSRLRVARFKYNWPIDDIEQAMRICAGADDYDPIVVKTANSTNCLYGYKPRDSVDWKWNLEEGYAFAHLLVLDGLSLVSRGNILPDMYVCVDCHEWTDGVRFVGIPADRHTEDGVDCGPDVCELLTKYWKQCGQSVVCPSKKTHIYALMDLGDECFTMVPKIGETCDTHIAEYRVVEKSPVGELMTFRTRMAGASDRYFRFSTREVRKLAPSGANAYQFVGEPRVADDFGPTHFAAEIQFYQVVVDETMRLMTPKELAHDTTKLMELLDLEAESS